MTEQTNNARGTQVADPELAALARIERLLAALEPAARCRVVGYLADRHGAAALEAVRQAAADYHRGGCNAPPLSPADGV